MMSLILRIKRKVQRFNKMMMNYKKKKKKVRKSKKKRRKCLPTQRKEWYTFLNYPPI